MYEKSWETIKGNCDSFLFLGGQEISTLEEVSKTLGKETIDVKGKNRTRGAGGILGGKNDSTSVNKTAATRRVR